MDNGLFGKMFDIEAEFLELENLIRILDDAVKNNDDSYYLHGYTQLIAEKMENYFDKLETFNQNLGQIIIHFQEQAKI